MKLVGPAAALGAATLLVYLLKPVAPVLSLGVVYTLAVLATAVVWGLVPAVVVAVASMVVFNFLFLPPVNTLTLADGRNWAALGVYVVTGVVASELATLARRRAADAEQRERETALIADAAAALLQQEPLDEIRQRADDVLARGDATARTRFDAAFAALVEAEAVRRSDAIKTIVLHTVSHDFRTPLATIRAAVDGLEDGTLELSQADRAGLLETISLEAARLSRLVENVLDLSRLQTGAAAPHPEVWAADDLLRHAAAESADPGRVRLVFPVDPPLVEVDAVQIQRAFVNVIDNALKFSLGQVCVELKPLDGKLEVDVIDDGGIDAAAGLGLGLEIARGFTTINGGSVRLERREAGGTIARFLLPVRELPQVAAT